MVKVSSDSVGSFESEKQDHIKEFNELKINRLEDIGRFTDNAVQLDKDLKSNMDDMHVKQRDFFQSGLKEDVPSGKTPSRMERNYPKKIVKGTPDSERIRIYRQERDLTAAMKLKIGEEDEELNEDNELIEDDSENEIDSVYSVSTNATSVRASRENINNLPTAIGETPKKNRSLDNESEEMGYVSDRVSFGFYFTIFPPVITIFTIYIILFTMFPSIFTSFTPFFTIFPGAQTYQDINSNKLLINEVK